MTTGLVTAVMHNEDLDAIAGQIERLLRSDHGPRLARLIVSRASERTFSGHEVSLVTKVQSEVARLYGVTRADVIGRSRSCSATKARMVAMFVVREWTGSSYPEIGRLFRRDHTTVISACRRAAGMRDADGMMTVERVMARLAPLRNSRCPVQFETPVNEDTTR